MIKLKTIPNTRNINPHWLDKEVPPFIVEWGDGTVETLRNTSRFKHKYKSKGEYTICVTGLQYPSLTFSDCVWLEKIHGVLEPVDSIKCLFKGCENLIHVDHDLLIHNTDHTDITRILAGARRLSDIKFVTKVVSVTCADFAFVACDMADLNQLSGWGENIVSMNFGFYDRKYATAPNENILHAMVNLESAISLFDTNINMIECPMYFKHNKKLKYIDNAFTKCDIKDINPNWLSHLPSTLETDRHNIFDPSVNINY